MLKEYRKLCAAVTVTEWSDQLFTELWNMKVKGAACESTAHNMSAQLESSVAAAAGGILGPMWAKVQDDKLPSATKAVLHVYVP